MADGSSEQRQFDTTDTERLRTMLRVGQAISSQRALRPLIAEVLRQSHALKVAHRRTFWLYDEDRDELYTFVGEGLSEEVRFPAGKGIVGAAAQRREVINIADAYESELFNPEVDRLTGYHTRSALAIPMFGRSGQLLGCFQALNRIDSAGEPLDVGERLPLGIGVFGASDVELLSALAGYAAIAVENAQLYEEQERMFQSMIVTLAQSVDARDLTTSSHTKLVTGIAVAIAGELGLSEETCERVRIAAILHDYGKIGVPDAILNKPGKHDADERQVMKSHCLKTILILSRIEFKRELRDLPAIAGMHHEYLDGTGYPFGLKGREIPLEGRILAVADIFQALTQTRPYKDGMPPQKALALLREQTGPHVDNRSSEECGQHLDPLVVDALEGVLEREGWDLGYFEQASGWEKMLSEH